jgi:hypothetical protein
MFLYYRIHGSLPLKYYGRKQANKSYLDNENVFAACRAWLLAQKITIVTPNDFRHVINIQIIPRLLANTKKPLFPKAKKAWKPLRRLVVYIWLHRLGFYKTKKKKSIYINRYKRENIIEYQQKDFFLKIAELDYFSIKYLENKKGEL